VNVDNGEMVVAGGLYSWSSQVRL